MGRGAPYSARFSMNWRNKHRLLYVLAAAAVACGARRVEAIDKRAMLSSGRHAQIRRPAVSSTSSGTYISAVLDDNGKFTVGTVQGDPARSSDDDADLIYGHPSPGTSDTMVR